MTLYRRATQPGFTIVELLIVIVVIGILAAITIVAFNGVQNRAHRSTAMSDLAAFRKKMEVYKIDATDELYPATPPSNIGISFTKSAYQVGRNNVYYCDSADRTAYAMGVVVKGTGSSTGYLMTPEAGIVESTNVSDATTCGMIGLASGSNMGHSWNGTVGTWQTWAG